MSGDERRPPEAAATPDPMRSARLARVPAPLRAVLLLLGLYIVVPTMRAVLRLVVRHLATAQRWERIDTEERPEYYTARTATDFADYLRGSSDVRVASAADVERWLRECEYVRTPERPDDWTVRPATFERERRGNCFDHAIWAWRQLRALGHDAELVIGRIVPAKPVRHAWVIVRGPTGGELWEATTKDGDRMARALSEVAPDEYWPELGIGADGRRFLYGGYLPRMLEDMERAWAERGNIVRRMFATD